MKKFYVHISTHELSCTNCETSIPAGIAFLRFISGEDTRWSVSGNLCTTCFERLGVKVKRTNPKK